MDKTILETIYQEAVVFIIFMFEVFVCGLFQHSILLFDVLEVFMFVCGKRQSR